MHVVFIVVPNGGTTVEIINCRNEADISGSSASACIGTFLSNEDKVITITNFVNLGDIKGSDKGQSYGIISIVAQDTTINLNNIYIDGKIEGQYVSGLIGSAILQNIKINAEQVAVNAQLIGSQKAVGFVNAGVLGPQTLSFTDCYFNGTGASCLVPTDSAVTTTYKGVFDGEAKTFYEGFNDGEWVTGVNNGTAGLRQFLAIGNLAPVIDVESYLASKGFTKA